jgi:hypothetical protein
MFGPIAQLVELRTFNPLSGVHRGVREGTAPAVSVGDAGRGGSGSGRRGGAIGPTLGLACLVLFLACSVDGQAPDDPGNGLAAACARRTGVRLAATTGGAVTAAAGTEPGRVQAFELCLSGDVRPGPDAGEASVE